MTRALSFGYGLICYGVFFLSLLYAIGFTGDLVVPKTIDSGPRAGLALSLVVNLVLLGLFAVQHTVMARPAFKRWWTKIVPDPLERSTYVLAASLLLFLLYWQWRPLPAVIWNVESAASHAALMALFWTGWLIVLASSFMVDHFDLFGLRQVWLHLRRREYRHLPFCASLLYRYLRHPLMLGLIVAFWATPLMTVGHLLFAIGTTAYILVGIQFEEHDLIRLLGQDYVDYRRRVPMLIPFLPKPGGKPPSPAPARSP